jgi:hypothetical protein
MLAVALLGAVLAVVQGAVAPAPARAAAGFTFGATGDHGSGTSTRSVLRAVGAADPDLFLSLGDLSYDTITPAAWCQMVKDELNAGAGRGHG